MVDETKMAFVTLTYDNDHLPEDENVSVRELQLFLKRLRKKGHKISYYACGEYGSKNYRPHYHLIMFGVSKYDKKDIEDAWSKGDIDVGTVKPQSIRYVLNYTKKAIDGRIYKGMAAPFQRMSKGIGNKISEDLKKKIFQDGYITLDGFKYSIPRYYLGKVFTEEEVEQIKAKRLLELHNSDVRNIPMFSTEYYSKQRQRERNILSKKNLRDSSRK